MFNIWILPVEVSLKFGSKMNYILKIFVILGLPFTTSCTNKITPTAKDGVIDLRNWDFKKYGSVPLRGEWQFYWKQLVHEGEGEEPVIVKVPSRWTKYKLEGKSLGQHGYGTFRLKILLPPGLNSTYFLNYYQNMLGSPKKVIINGLEVFKNGLVEENPKENTYTKKRMIFHSEILNNTPKGSESFEILVQNSNAIGEMAGILRYPEIGERQELNTRNEKRAMLNAILIGFFLMLFMYYFAMFLLQKERKSYLYFSLLCFSFVLINHNVDWPDLFGLDFKITFVLGYCLVCSYPLFINSVCDEKVRLNKIIYGIGVYAFLGPFITLVFDTWENYYFSFFVPHLTLFNIMSFSTVTIIAFRNWRLLRNSQSFCYFISCFISIPFFINDILHGLLIIQTAFILNYVFFTVVIMQAFILAWGNATAHNEVKVLAGELGELNVKLEEKVTLRTTELEQKNLSMSKILENIHQGIFMIDENLTIDPQYSSHLTEIIGEKDIGGKDIKTFFLSKTNLNANDLSQIESALMCCLGDPDFTFKLNASHLPRELILQTPTSQKQLEVSWEPIIIDENIDKLMVSIREVTEIRRLKEQAAVNKANNKKLVEIVSCGLGSFSNNIQTMEDYLNKSREIIISLNGRKGSKDQINEIFRNLHTVKGNARSLQLSEVVKYSHETEQMFDKLRKSSGMIGVWDEKKYLMELDRLKDVIASYRELYIEKLGGSEDEENESISLEDMTDKLIKVLDDVDHKQTGYKEAHNIIYKSLRQLKYKNLSQILRQQLAILNKDAHKLGKASPIIDWGDTPIWVPKEKAYVLSDIFGHILRNSIDHGLEKPKARIAKGKKEAGTLSFAVSYSAKSLSLRYSDDGKGLNIRELRKKHNKKDGSSDLDLAELIFESGFSTSHKRPST